MKTKRKGGIGFVQAANGPETSSRLAEQRPEAFLLEMLVVRKNLGQTFVAHSLHRNTILKAVAFVRPGAIQAQTGKKRFPTLRNNLHTGVLQNILDSQRNLATQEFRASAEKG